MLKKRIYKNYVTTHIEHSKKGIQIDRITLKSFEKHYLNKIPQNLNKDSIIIDIGCGDGALVHWLNQKGYKNVLGIDLSEEQIKLSKYASNIRLKVADVFDFLQNETCKYDLIIVRDVLEHFDKEKLADLLNLFNKSLKENGTILAQVPNANSPFSTVMRYGDFTHELSFTEGSIFQILTIANFNNVLFYPFDPIVSSIKSFFRFFLYKTMEHVYKFLLSIHFGYKKNRIISYNIIFTCQKKS